MMIVVAIFEFIVDYGSLGKIMILWLNMIQQWSMMVRVVLALIIYLAKMLHNTNYIVKLQHVILMSSLWVKTLLSLHMDRQVQEKPTLCLVPWMILKIMVLYQEHCNYLIKHSQ